MSSQRQHSLDSFLNEARELKERMMQTFPSHIALLKEISSLPEELERRFWVSRVEALVETVKRDYENPQAEARQVDFLSKFMTVGIDVVLKAGGMQPIAPPPSPQLGVSISPSGKIRPDWLDNPDREPAAIFLTEEGHAPQDWAKDVSGGTADVSWTWDEVGIPTPKIMPLVNAGLLGIVFSSRSSTHYALVGRVVIKRVLGELEKLREEASLTATFDREIETPENLFSTVAGYEEIKAFLKKVLKAERFHVLLVGPPASAKTVFLLELARLPGSFYCLGSATTKAGIAEILYEQRPRILLADEVDKFESKDLAILLSLAETGIVRETKVSKQREVRLSTSIFAAANSAKGMPRELLSRFRVLNLPPYTREEFINASTKVLIEREKVAPSLACYIAERAWELSRDIREVVRIGRICQNRDEVDQDIRLMEKYGLLRSQ
jgi:Holliday junction DNA helicase RuvB